MRSSSPYCSMTESRDRFADVAEDRNRRESYSRAHHVRNTFPLTLYIPGPFGPSSKRHCKQGPLVPTSAQRKTHGNRTRPSEIHNSQLKMRSLFSRSSGPQQEGFRGTAEVRSCQLFRTSTTGKLFPKVPILIVPVLLALRCGNNGVRSNRSHRSPSFGRRKMISVPIPRRCIR